mgnify:CR=1 FL=1
MKFKAEIDVMPHDALLDPQGKAVTHAMSSIGMHEIEGVRIGRHIRLFVETEWIIFYARESSFLFQFTSSWPDQRAPSF